MAALTVTKVLTTGIAPSTYLTAAASGGDTFSNNGNTFFHIKNAGGSPINVTFGAVVDTVVAVTNAEERLIGPFSTGTYNDSGGDVQVTYSAVTSVTVAPISMQ